MDIPPTLKAKSRLISAWKAGVGSVVGREVTRNAVADDQLEAITHVLAVGKAASSMCAGLRNILAGNGKALVVTKYGHGDPGIDTDARIEVIESGHPVPDENSLRAGVAMAEFVSAVPADAELVMLVSGGASALAEWLPETVDLLRLQEITGQLLADGYSIDQVNAVRIRISRIKGGKLLQRFGGRSVRVYAISDVPGDSIDLIGSGIGSIQPLDPDSNPVPAAMEELLVHLEPAATQALEPIGFEYHLRIVGCNEIARSAAAAYLAELDLPVVTNQESLHLDVNAAAQLIGARLLTGPSGAYIWGGEPTVILPSNPGIGGRNQSLALAVAREIRGSTKIAVLVAGTDGSDASTNAAGGLVDGDTFNAASGADKALMKADAGSYLARISALFKPGPTGTNVMDLVIAIKR